MSDPANLLDNESRCPTCGAVIPPDAPEGLCPSCLAKQGGAGPDKEPGAADPPFAAPSADELDPTIESYDIIELVGVGGMGAVYKARQAHLARIVALKLLPPRSGHSDPEFAERFKREAQAMARLSHPNIVTVHDFGETRDGQFYLVMEFVAGTTLADLIHLGGTSPAEALAIVPQVCDGLQFAHSQGIVHRDIKPANILIDTGGTVKLTDFGLAKILGSPSERQCDLTLEGRVMGTLNYMAPEQASGSPTIDHRADIYSLGVVFYELLTGQVPKGVFEPPSKKVEIDVRLDEVVLRAMQSEPERRYQQASEVKQDIEEITAARTDFVVPRPAAPAVSNEPIASAAASPEGRPSQCRKPGRGALFAMCGVIALLAVLIWAFWGQLFPPGPTQPENSLPENHSEVPPDVILVGAGEGKGRLTDALNDPGVGEKIKVVRITDDQLYPEAIDLSSPRFEGVTIEATGGAKLSGPVTIRGVKNVQIRGFEIVMPEGTDRFNSVAVAGAAGGCVLEDLTIKGEGWSARNWIGIDVVGLKLEEGDEPLEIRQCRFEDVLLGVRASGSENDRETPLRCRGVIVKNCTFLRSLAGFGLGGEVRDAAVANNVFIECARAVLFQNVLGGTRRVLIANNTFRDCERAFQLFDASVLGEEVRIFNNLALGTRDPVSWAYIKQVPGVPMGDEPAGDGTAVAEAWDFGWNWREGTEPAADTPLREAWIPLGKESKLIETIEGIDRDPNGENYLQPVKGSALSNAGAGRTHEGLAPYVGGVPPEGVAKWEPRLALGENQP